DSKSKIVKEILANVMAGIPMIDLNARASGSWNHLNIHMNSNLGDELAKGFKAQLQAKIEEAKKKIQNIIDKKIGAEKAKLEGEFNKLKSQVNGLVKSKQQEVEKAKKTAQNQLNKQKKD